MKSLTTSSYNVFNALLDLKFISPFSIPYIIVAVWPLSKLVNVIVSNALLLTNLISHLLLNFAASVAEFPNPRPFKPPLITLSKAHFWFNVVLVDRVLPLNSYSPVLGSSISL